MGDAFQCIVDSILRFFFSAPAKENGSLVYILLQLLHLFLSFCFEYSLGVEKVRLVYWGPYCIRVLLALKASGFYRKAQRNKSLS